MNKITKFLVLGISFICLLGVTKLGNNENQISKNLAEPDVGLNPDGGTYTCNFADVKDDVCGKKGEFDFTCNGVKWYLRNNGYSGIWDQFSYDTSKESIKAKVYEPRFTTFDFKNFLITKFTVFASCNFEPVENKPGIKLQTAFGSKKSADSEAYFNVPGIGYRLNSDEYYINSKSGDSITICAKYGMGAAGFGFCFSNTSLAITQDLYVKGFEIEYIKMPDKLDIPGATLVTNEDQIVSDEQYLLVGAYEYNWGGDDYKSYNTFVGANADTNNLRFKNLSHVSLNESRIIIEKFTVDSKNKYKISLGGLKYKSISDCYYSYNLSTSNLILCGADAAPELKFSFDENTHKVVITNYHEDKSCDYYLSFSETASLSEYKSKNWNSTFQNGFYLYKFDTFKSSLNFSYNHEESVYDFGDGINLTTRWTIPADLRTDNNVSMNFVYSLNYGAIVDTERVLVNKAKLIDDIYYEFSFKNIPIEDKEVIISASIEVCEGDEVLYVLHTSGEIMSVKSLAQRYIDLYDPDNESFNYTTFLPVLSYIAE